MNATIISVTAFVSIAPLDAADWVTEKLRDSLEGCTSATVFGSTFGRRDLVATATFVHTYGEPLPKIFECGKRGLRITGYEVMALTEADIELGSDLVQGGYQCDASQFGDKILITVDGQDLARAIELVSQVSSGQVRVY